MKMEEALFIFQRTPPEVKRFFQQLARSNFIRKKNVFVLENGKIHPQYLRSQHLLYPADCQVFGANVVYEGLVQAFLPRSCWVATKTPVKPLILHYMGGKSLATPTI